MNRGLGKWRVIEISVFGRGEGMKAELEHHITTQCVDLDLTVFESQSYLLVMWITFSGFFSICVKSWNYYIV